MGPPDGWLSWGLDSYVYEGPVSLRWFKLVDLHDEKCRVRGGVEVMFAQDECLEVTSAQKEGHGSLGREDVREG